MYNQLGYYSYLGRLNVVLYDPVANDWTISTSLEVRNYSGNEAALLPNGKLLVMLAGASTVFDPGATAPASSGQRPQPAENPLNSSALTPYLALAAMFFLLVLGMRFAHAQLSQRRRPS
jgi:hypothetical protein